MFCGEKRDQREKTLIAFEERHCSCSRISARSGSSGGGGSFDRQKALLQTVYSFSAILYLPSLSNLLRAAELIKSIDFLFRKAGGKRHEKIAAQTERSAHLHPFVCVRQ